MLTLFEPEPSRAREITNEAEFRVCKAAPAYFTDRYGVIDDVQDFEQDAEDGEGPSAKSGVPATTPFRIWPDQRPLFDDLERESQVIILKARQLGISWVVCAYVLWFCVFHPGRVVLLFSKGQREADELIRRILALFTRLPDWLRGKLPRLTVDNVRELQWANGSSVRSMPATADAGVSYTASLIVLDEAAKMKFGRQLYVAAKPTIDNGGQIVVLSSANGFGGFFHNLWQKASQGLNSFKPVFLPWQARPDRDRAWYEKMVRDSDDPALVAQEYPANPIEAFVASGRLRFNPAHVARQHMNIREPLPARDWPPEMHARKFWPGLDPSGVLPLSHVPGLCVYAPPVPGRRYLLAADVAEGKDPEGKRDSDFDSAVLLDEETWEEVASLDGRWEPDEYARSLIALAEPYGATVLVERNNHGHAVLLALKHLRFPAARLGLGHDGWPGWLTSGQTKPEGMTLLSGGLRDNLVTVRTRKALYQMHQYTVLKNGGTGAPAGGHDDFVSAWAVGLSWFRRRTLRGGEPGGPVTGGDPPRVAGHLYRRP